MTKAVHISDIRTFRTCRRKWGWASPLKANLEPAIPYVPFFTGRAFHAALEYYYRDHTPFDETLDKYLTSEEANMAEIGEMWPSEKEAFDEQIELIRSIIQHYSVWQAQDTKTYCDNNLEFISLEQEFNIPLPIPKGVIHPTLGIPSNGHWHPHIHLGGRFDGVMRHIPSNTYWLWETKTTRSIQELTTSLANDEQCGVYMYAASKMLNVPIKGVLYNMVRKKAPSLPSVLKNGSLSKAVSVDTTHFMYQEEVKAMFPDFSDETIEDEYGQILETLRENEFKFFMRYPVYRSAYELEMLMANVYHTAMEMVNPNTVLYPAPSWLNCNFCSFKSACLTMNAGGNYEVLLEEEFVNRKSNTSMKPDKEE